MKITIVKAVMLWVGACAFLAHSSHAESEVKMNEADSIAIIQLLFGDPQLPEFVVSEFPHASQLVCIHKISGEGPTAVMRCSVLFGSMTIEFTEPDSTKLFALLSAYLPVTENAFEKRVGGKELACEAMNTPGLAGSSCALTPED